MLECPEPQDYINTNLQNCKSRAVEIGANAIQFLDNYCRFKNCGSPGDTSDLMREGPAAMWQSYYCAPPPPATCDSFTGCQSSNLNKGSGVSCPSDENSCTEDLCCDAPGNYYKQFLYNSCFYQCFSLLSQK